jgi:tetratricopeptide (TPR) repeat protein
MMLPTLTILFTLALTIPPAEEPDWLDLFLQGSRLLEQGDAEAAIDDLERALELQPRHAPTALQLAGARARAGDASGALDQLEAGTVRSRTPFRPVRLSASESRVLISDTRSQDALLLD